VSPSRRQEVVEQLTWIDELLPRGLAAADAVEEVDDPVPLVLRVTRRRAADSCPRRETLTNLLAVNHDESTRLTIL
jgi:hypothetical protein